MSTGIRMVMTRKLLARTRSRYSRFAMSQTLCIGFASYGFNKDLFERGFHNLEPGDASTVLDGCSQNLLRGGFVAKLDLCVSGVVLGFSDAGMLQKACVAF